MDECRISDMIPEALDLDPCGGLRTSWDTRCAPKDSTNGIYFYMAQNNHLSKCGIVLVVISRIYADTLHATPNVCLKALHPKCLDEVIWKIPLSESDDRWINRSTLVGSQMGWKETAIWTQTLCSSLNPQTDLRPHWLSCALCNGYS